MVSKETKPKRHGTKHPRSREIAADVCGVAHAQIGRAKRIKRDDPLALVVSLNVKRRNLTASQRAVAAAEAWDACLKSGKGAKAAQLGDLFDCSRDYVNRARALVARAPDLAESVKAGNRALAEAPRFPPS